jgi:hypothetical protein
LQHRKGLRPKGNLVSIQKETAAIKIQDITIESQSPWPRWSVGITRGHGLAMKAISLDKRRFSICISS